MPKGKRSKKASSNNNRTEAKPPVRETSVQTEDTSPLLYTPPRLSADDMGLFQSVMSKDPQLPEVLMAEDDLPVNNHILPQTSPIESCVREKMDFSSRKLQEGTFSVETREQFMPRTFPGIPMRKTAPRGRAHVIHRNMPRDATKVYLNQTELQNAHDSNGKQGSDMTNHASLLEDTNHTSNENILKDNCEQLAITTNKNKQHFDGEGSCEKSDGLCSSENIAIVEAYKKVIYKNKSNISRHTNSHDNQSCIMEATPKSVSSQEDKLLVMANDNGKQTKSYKSPMVLKGVASYKNWQRQNLLKKVDCNNNLQAPGIFETNVLSTPPTAGDTGGKKSTDDLKKSSVAENSHKPSSGNNLSEPLKNKGQEQIALDPKPADKIVTESSQPLVFLELQEPSVSLNENINACTNGFLPLLLRPTVVHEAEVDVTTGSSELLLKQTNDLPLDKDITMGDLPEKQIVLKSSETDEPMTGKPNKISQLLNKLNSEVHVDKISRKLDHKQYIENVTNDLEKAKSRPTRKCAPMVFYEKDKNKQVKTLKKDKNIDVKEGKQLTALNSLNIDNVQTMNGVPDSRKQLFSGQLIVTKMTTLIPPPQKMGRIIGKRGLKRKMQTDDIVHSAKRQKTEVTNEISNANEGTQRCITGSGKCVETETVLTNLCDVDSTQCEEEDDKDIDARVYVAEIFEDKMSKAKKNGMMSEKNIKCCNAEMTEVDGKEKITKEHKNDCIGTDDNFVCMVMDNDKVSKDTVYGIEMVNSTDDSIDKSEDRAINDNTDEDNVNITDNLYDTTDRSENITVGQDMNLDEGFVVTPNKYVDRDGGLDETSKKGSESNIHTGQNVEEVTDFIAGRIKEKAIKKYREMGKFNRGTSGWEDCLRQKPKKTEFFQVNTSVKAPVKESHNKSGVSRPLQALNAEEKKSKHGRPKLVNKEEKVCIDPFLDVRKEQRSSDDPNFGHIVWGKLGRQRWWPAIVIEGDMVLREQAEPGTSWLFWFGDHKISMVSREKIVPYVANFEKFYGGKQNGALFKQAVTEAVKVCADRCGYNTHDDRNRLDWAQKGFLKEDDSSPLDNDVFSPSKDKPIPDMVLEGISELRSIMKKNMENNVDDTSEDRDDDGDALETVKSQQRKLEDICISCNDLNQKVVCQHPLFVGGLCNECKQEVLESFFAIGEDGTGMFCVVCSSGGKMFVCENDDCSSVFCLDCIKLFMGKSYITKIEQTSPWLCFLCCEYSKETHGLLIPKSDWQHSVIQLFDTGYRIQDQDFNYLLNNEEKKKIRVLSLFDGIGTGKVVLDQLGLDVEVYYTSEIDADSLLVTTFHYGDTVTPLGDITKLTETKLKEISPIDLLIGGSPCNDLSLANPVRKGFSDFSSSAILFFDYFRVLTCLQKFANGRHVFWLYENVASMKKECSEIISRFLQCQPALWDAKYFSAQARPRFFWGNIPGMYSTPDLTDIKTTADLDDVLSPKCNRKATVKIMRTVTTRQNSLKQGKNDAFFPVTMNGKDDMIWVSELERIFGFPDHYTDVGNIPVTRRRQMIGKAWSVPVVKNILHILADFFALRKN